MPAYASLAATAYPPGDIMLESELTPGALVRHPKAPDWGIGQVQSRIGSRVTVNFEHAGKVLIDISEVELDAVDEY